MQTDMVLLQRVPKGDAAPAGKRIVGAHHDDEPIGAIRQTPQPLGFDVIRADADFGEARGNPFDDAGARPFLEVDLDGRMPRI
jgi:hypothetical protein